MGDQCVAEDTAPRSHWHSVAERWSQVGPPLRPSAGDMAAYRRAAGEWLSPGAAPRVLLLGVTPEIYAMPWPAATDFAAVDRSEAMIAAIWPGPPGRVTRSDWRELPHPAASRDLVICDGGWHLLPWECGQRALARELARVLAPGGLAILRLFIPPAEAEATSAVLESLRAGRIASASELKLRLALSFQPAPGRGVALAAVWQALQQAAPDVGALSRQSGIPLEQLAAIDSYRDSSDEYFFVSLDQVEQVMCGDDAFRRHEVIVPRVPLGERCPIVVFQRV